MKNNPDNRGMIIVFTLILLAVFLTTALSFSYFIIGDINKARAVDNSVIAYYAADSGLEESLYLLKKQEVGNMEQLKGILSGDRTLALSEGVWNIGDSTDFEKTVLRQRLYNGQSAKFFIFNRATANPIRSLTLEWYKGNGTAAKLQVNFTQLNPQDQNGTLVYYTDTSELEIADTATNGFATCYSLKDADLLGSALPDPVDYLAEFKVLGGTNDYVDRLLVKAYNKRCGEQGFGDSLNQQGITNLTLKSKGSYGKATQNIVAHLLPKDPVSGILSFVLFSEQDITKDN